MARRSGCPGDTAIVDVDGNAYAFDARTGERLWIRSCAHLLDAAAGAEIWTDDTIPRSFGADPVVHRDGNTLSMVANTGTLVRHDFVAARLCRCCRCRTHSRHRHQPC